jgi:hypothetical protein
MAVPPPEVLALVVADTVHRDDETGKVYIIGTRFTIHARAFPWTHPRIAAYMALVEGRGEVKLEIRVVDMDEGNPIAQTEVMVTFPDPLDELDLAIFLSDVVFPEPGEYRLQLYADDQFLRERRLSLILRENPDQT